MHTRHTMCRKKRLGISSILGTIIFVGILFSVYVPMTLVMKQADNIYERKIHEAKIGDFDKAGYNRVEAVKPALNVLTLLILFQQLLARF